MFSILVPPPATNPYGGYSPVSDIPTYGTLPASSLPAYGTTTLPASSHVSPQYSPARYTPTPNNVGGGLYGTCTVDRALVGTEAYPAETSIQGVSGSNVYAVPNPDLLWQEEVNLMEIPREKLQFVEKLGHGQFGEVHLCELTTFEDDSQENQTFLPGSSMLVAVKTLKDDAKPGAR